MCCANIHCTVAIRGKLVATIQWHLSIIVKSLQKESTTAWFHDLKSEKETLVQLREDILLLTCGKLIFDIFSVKSVSQTLDSNNTDESTRQAIIELF